jgi:hypothetical protein
MSESGPGWAKFTGEDTPQDVDRKMRDAFLPFKAMYEGYRRAFDPKHRWRDIHSGRFIRKDGNR